jgi:uncharacterized delta-60 repeat protein
VFNAFVRRFSWVFATAVSISAWVTVAPMAVANPTDLDPDFATGGTFTGEDSNCAEFRRLLILADGRILAGANAADPPPNEGSIHRFLPNGSRDTSFGGGDGIVWLLDLVGTVHPNVSGIAEFPNGEIASTVFDGSDLWVVRLDESGAPVVSFSGDGILPGPWNALARTGTDSLIVAGKNASGLLLLGQLDSTGALVSSFGSGGTVTAFSVDGTGAAQVIVQPDGKILVGGDRSGGFYVARFLSDGTPDDSFGTEGLFEHVGALEAFREMVLTSDGSVVVTGCEAVGGFCSGGTDSPIAVRLTSSGMLDPSLDGDGIASPSPPLGAETQGVAVQRNGKVLLSGHASPIERLLFDGSLDPEFGSSGIGTKVGWKVAVQRNGRILVAGSDNNSPGSNYRCQLHRLLGDPVTVPALSEWSVAALALLLIISGPLLYRTLRRV